MNKLIIITGDLASGKSTLANTLSDQLSITCLTKDHMKEILCDAIGYANREENRKLSIGAVNSMLHVFEQAAKVSDDLILEGNFRTEELLRMKDIAEDNSYQVVLLFLTGDTNLIYQRFLDRLPGRHIAHISLGLDRGVEYFEEYVSSQRNQDFIFPVNEINMTKLDEDDVVGKALDILSNEGLI